MAKDGWRRSLSRWIYRSDKQQIRAETSAQVRRRLRRLPAVLFAVSAALLLVAAAVWVWIGLGPDKSQAPVEVTAAMLIEGTAPTGREVVLRGVSVETARTQVRRRQRTGSVRWTYTGFRVGERRDSRADAVSDTAPIVLFTAIWWGTLADTIAHRPASETVTGILIENGLPSDAYAALEAKGVSIAARHYVVQVGEDGSRDGYLRLVWLCLIFGGLFAVIAGVMAVKTAKTCRLIGQAEDGVASGGAEGQ